jgi:hypothetical protein
VIIVVFVNLAILGQWSSVIVIVFVNLAIYSIAPAAVRKTFTDPGPQTVGEHVSLHFRSFVIVLFARPFIRTLTACK